MKSYMVLHQLIHLSGPLDVYATSTSRSPFVTNLSLRLIAAFFSGTVMIIKASDASLCAVVEFSFLAMSHLMKQLYMIHHLQCLDLRESCLPCLNLKGRCHICCPPLLTLLPLHLRSLFCPFLPHWRKCETRIPFLQTFESDGWVLDLERVMSFLIALESKSKISNNTSLFTIEC